MAAERAAELYAAGTIAPLRQGAEMTQSELPKTCRSAVAWLKHALADSGITSPPELASSQHS